MAPCKIIGGGGAHFAADLWRCVTCGQEKYPEVFSCPMAAFGAQPHFPTYVGGGDLWGEPEPPQLNWWQRLLAVFGIRL